MNQLCAHGQNKQQQPKKGNRAGQLAPCLLVDLFCLSLKLLVQLCLKGAILDMMGKHLTLFNNIKPETQIP